MSEFNYLKEKRRMLNSIGRKNSACLGAVCDRCPISYKNNKRNRHCAEFEMMYPDKATEKVRKWSEEHPIKTRKDLLLEKFPDTPLDNRGIPNICPYNLGMMPKGCPFLETLEVNCVDCWNMEVENDNYLP